MRSFWNTVNFLLFKFKSKRTKKVWNRFKVNNKNTRTMSVMSSHLFLVFLLLTFSRCMFAGNELLIDCSFGLVLPDYHVTENLRKVICTVCITWTYGATSQEENNENNGTMKTMKTMKTMSSSVIMYNLFFAFLRYLRFCPDCLVM